MCLKCKNNFTKQDLVKIEMYLNYLELVILDPVYAEDWLKKAENEESF